MSEELERLSRAAETNALHRTVEVGTAVVRRPAGPATATVHSYLRHLRARGLSCVPEPLGVQDGVELLRTLDGEGGGEGWYHKHTDEGLTSAARLLRDVHDAGRDWVPPADAVWGAPPREGADVVACHGDPGPWNFLWRDRRAVGLVDWDYLHPAPRTDDVAYALLWFAPLRTDEMALAWRHFPQVPDRSSRVRAFLDAYGPAGTRVEDVVDEVVACVARTAALELDLARRGGEPQRSWGADGSQEAAAAEIRWLHEHRALVDVPL